MRAGRYEREDLFVHAPGRSRLCALRSAPAGSPSAEAVGPVDLARGGRGPAQRLHRAREAGQPSLPGRSWRFWGARGGGVAGAAERRSALVVAGTRKGELACWAAAAPARQHGNTATLLQTIIFLFSSSNGFSNACKCAFCSVDLRLLACRAFRAADSRDGRVSGEPPQESQCNVSLIFCPVRGRCRTSGSSWGLSRRERTPLAEQLLAPALPLSPYLEVCPARPALPRQ